MQVFSFGLFLPWNAGKVYDNGDLFWLISMYLVAINSIQK